MRTHKLVAILLCLAVILSIFSPVSSQIVAPPKGTVEPALLPWVDQIFSADSDAYFLSADFGGKYQIPIFNYIIADDLYFAYKVDGTTDGCGPDSAWTCKLILSDLGSPPFYSPLTSFSFTDTFLTAWVYQNGTESLMYYSKYWAHDFSSSGSAVGVLLRLNTGTYNGYHLAGRPSLAYDSEGHIQGAVILSNNSVEKLVYIYMGDITNTSCGFSTTWTCDEIDSGRFSGLVQLSITASDSPRISYNDLISDQLIYAYPTNILVPGTCGPGDTWRCIMIDEGTGDDTIYPVLSMDFGSGSPQIAYIEDKSGMLPQRLLRHAKFVGVGGNCGWDTWYNIGLQSGYRWNCTDVAVIDSQSPFIASPFSLKVDPDNFPVIAYAYVDGASSCLGVTYPPERVGGAPGAWIGDEIDCPASDNIALALNNAGLGFVVFNQFSDPSNTNIAFQHFILNLPIIRR